MTEAKHALGPWTIDTDAGVHQVIDANGYWVCECMANSAPLIAAAPDMLAELNRLFKLYPHSETAEVITKATGDTTTTDSER